MRSTNDKLEALQNEMNNANPYDFQTPIFDSVVDKLREIDNNIVEYCGENDGTSALVFDILADDGYFGFDILTCDVAIKELNKMFQTTLRKEIKS